MPGETATPTRTLSPEQKARMALGKARKAAIDAGLPDPFPNGIPGTAEAQPAPQPVASAPAIANRPVAVARPQLSPDKAEVAPEPIAFGPHDIVRVFNPDDEPFQFRFGTKARYDGKGKVVEGTIEPITYTIDPNTAIPMHGYMADYVCNHLTSKILQKTGQVKQLNSPIVRKAWAIKIILGKEDMITPEAKLSESEQIQKKFNDIQKQDASPVVDDENEAPTAEADALLGDMDLETAAEHGDGDFPGVETDPTAA